MIGGLWSKECLWAVLLALALADRRARPQALLLLASWVYSYALVLMGGDDNLFGYAGSSAASVIVFAVMWWMLEEGRRAPVRTDDTGWQARWVFRLQGASLVMQASFWLLSKVGVWIGEQTYWGLIFAFTAQTLALAIPAPFRLFSRWRVRTKLEAHKKVQ